MRSEVKLLLLNFARRPTKINSTKPFPRPEPRKGSRLSGLFVCHTIINFSTGSDTYQTIRKLTMVCACESECDVPVPGIPVPGNLSFYLMLSEKFGVEKVSEPVSEKNWDRKSLGTGHRNIWSRSQNFPVLRLSHLTFSNLLYPFPIFTSQFLVRILVSVWVSVSVSSHSRDSFGWYRNRSQKNVGTGKSPGIGLRKMKYREKSRNRSQRKFGTEKV